ncbi:MAG: DUF1997 domain-containing protein [Cyanobacteria bacterium K_Offshore_0m_m2_072]|nr:DUF1997 domain-containing protein [Cyanobacteria bacterium K_Offshore_0m_m2_072]
MRLEQRRAIAVTLTAEAMAGWPVDAIEARLQSFFSRPIRPLQGLLDPSRLQAASDDCYVYQSRPYGVAGWTLQPQVTLRARWDGQCLAIEQLAARVEGLGEWQERLRFGLAATMRPEISPSTVQLEASAVVWAELPGGAGALVAPVLDLALQQLLDRLERRCKQGLRRRTEAWLDREPPLPLPPNVRPCQA